MLQFNKKNKLGSGRVCLHVTEEGTSIAASRLQGTKLQLQTCQYFSALDIAESPDIIQDFIEKNNLSGASCSLVLNASEYQLLLSEAPLVSEHEICEALWWKVKDLVAFDIENAQIDYLDLPEDSAKHQGRKMYAVIADKKKIKARIDWAESLGLTPIAVEIPETALLHLVSDLCSSVTGTSILYLDSEQSLLMLMSESNMYLTRTLQYNYLERMDAVVLDLQRSMDYYESQIGKPPCSKVVVLPQHESDSAMMQTLAINIGVEISSVDINQLIDSLEPIPSHLEQHCLLVISGALRLDKKAKK